MNPPYRTIVPSLAVRLSMIWRSLRKYALLLLLIDMIPVLKMWQRKYTRGTFTDAIKHKQ